MTKIPVLDKVKLNKNQTYFVNAASLNDILGDCHNASNIALRFSDDPGLIKSNYERFVKQTQKLVLLSARYEPSNDESDKHEYTITVYAIERAIREDLIAKFEKEHYATLTNWLIEKRDNIWKNDPHSLHFLIDIENEEIATSFDIDFSKFSRHSKKQKFRTDGRNR